MEGRGFWGTLAGGTVERSCYDWCVETESPELEQEVAEESEIWWGQGGRRGADGGIGGGMVLP